MGGGRERSERNAAPPVSAMTGVGVTRLRMRSTPSEHHVGEYGGEPMRRLPSKK